MSKFLSFVFLAAAINVGASQAANAGHRYYRCYCWNYYPPTPVVAAPAVVSPKVAPPVSRTAQSDSLMYRSFSTEPGPAPANSEGTVYSGTYNVGPYADPGNLNASQDDPSGMHGTVIGGTPSTGSNYGTAGNPNGGSNAVTIGTWGSFSGGGTQGGTAGHPY
jgi:hypothetical protein